MHCRRSSAVSLSIHSSHVPATAVAPRPLRAGRSAGVVLALLGLLASLTAQAGDDWTLGVMGGAGFAPRYNGSKETLVVPAFGISATAPYGFFLNADQGLGWGSELGHGFATQLYAGISPERKDHKTSRGGSNELRGMGDIRSAAQFGWDLDYRLGPVVLKSGLIRKLRRGDDPDTDRGYTRWQLGLGSELYRGGAGTFLIGTGVTGGDRQYMQTWYGVSAAQSTRSRHAAYQAKGGLEGALVYVGWSYPVLYHTDLAVNLNAQRLLGEAAKSPLVEQKLQLSGGVTLGYRF